MYAIAFDLVVADTEKHHPRGVSQAYTDIGAILGEHGLFPCSGESLCDRKRGHGDSLHGHSISAHQGMVSKIRSGYSGISYRTVV